MKSSTAFLIAGLFVVSTIAPAKCRIVGGIKAAIGAYPSYVHLADGILCGGSLIYPDIVLTCAHCGASSFSGKSVHIGANSLFGGPQGETISVEATYTHPDYDQTGNEENDIMILKLAYNSSAPLVTLGSEPSQGSKVDVIGFGYTADPYVDDSAGVSSDLMEVEVTVQDFDVCATRIRGIQYEDSQICAGELDGGKDSCYGDSGGPLFLAGSNIQVGIVSYGVGCARVSRPAIYTEVSAYQDFIDSAVCSMSDHPPARCSTSSATSEPSAPPSVIPTTAPSQQPTDLASSFPTTQPSPAPSVYPTYSPSDNPTDAPVATPSNSPSTGPSRKPSGSPTNEPSFVPSLTPSAEPSITPSMIPSKVPSQKPSQVASSMPSPLPSNQPSVAPSKYPSNVPSQKPSSEASNMPSPFPSQLPSIFRSQAPTTIPSEEPTDLPTSSIPSQFPSSTPSGYPSPQTSSFPSSSPNLIPTAFPTIVVTSAPTWLKCPRGWRGMVCRMLRRRLYGRS